MISFKWDDEDIRRTLEAIVKAGGRESLQASLKGIGENLTTSTKERFYTSIGPDGETWQDNSDATLDAYINILSGKYDKQGKRIGTKNGYFKTDGALGKRGQKVRDSKKPLIGETRQLSTQIYYKIIDDFTVAIGSPQEYSAMMQFGGKKSEFPNLWGDIPARPFLGVSKEDKNHLMKELTEYLESIIDGRI
jgi:phage gpG-like protein